MPSDLEEFSKSIAEPKVPVISQNGMEYPDYGKAMKPIPPRQKRPSYQRPFVKADGKNIRLAENSEAKRSQAKLSAKDRVLYSKPLA